MTKARVLLVEDDPAQANETRTILQGNGYEVLWAQDGISAIRIVKTDKPDIILLDVILPGMDGYEVCRWLKTEESTKGVPVIMLTVKRELSDKISGLHIGADDYLPKPYNDLELIARIYASLRTKALQDELRMKNRQLEELLQKVEHMAITDALTGLYNRRRFLDALSREFEKAKRYTMPFSLVMLDIDHFKGINDRYGHQAGDEVLKEVSGILMKNVREVDTVARYGGEEFVILLPNTDRQQAGTGAERIRESIAEYPFSGLNDHVTVSIGVCGLPDGVLNSEESFIRCADFTLYKAKLGGRNRTEIGEGKDLKNS